MPGPEALRHLLHHRQELIRTTAVDMKIEWWGKGAFAPCPPGLRFGTVAGTLRSAQLTIYPLVVVHAQIRRLANFSSSFCG